MKISKPVKKPGSSSREKESDAPKKSSLYVGGQSGGLSWASTNANEFASLAKQAQTENRRAPEFWLKDGEKKLVRFLDDEPVISFQVYKLKIGGKWQTSNRNPENDLIAGQLGLKPSRVFLYRLLDVEGYTPTQGPNAGKKVTNAARFLKASTRQFESLKEIKEEFGTTKDFPIKMSRSGDGTNTTYTFIPKSPEPLTPDQRKSAASFPKWEEYYQPATARQQQELINQAGKNPQY